METQDESVESKRRSPSSSSSSSSSSVPVAAKKSRSDGIKDEVYMERTIGLLGTIGLVLGSIIGMSSFTSVSEVIDTVNWKHFITE